MRRKSIWSRKSLIGDIAPVVTDNESAMFFLLLDRNSSSSFPCECRYAVVGISAVRKVWTTPSEVRVEETKGDNVNLTNFTGVAVTRQGLVLVMAGNGHYSLFSSQWYNLNNSFAVVKGYHVIAAFYFPKRRLYILVLDDTAMIYGLDERSWMSPNSFSGAPEYIPEYRYVTMTTDKLRFLLYGGGLNDCEQVLYELNEYISGILKGWKEIETPNLSPSALDTFAESVDCIEDDLFVVVDAQQEKKQLWQLHFNAMTWTFLKDLITGTLPDPTDVSLMLESSSVQTADFFGSVYISCF